MFKLPAKDHIPGMESISFDFNKDENRTLLTYKFQLTPDCIDAFRDKVLCGVVDLEDNSEVTITVKNVK